jgi:RNA polymerase sigma-70 factor (ECF subfamily)
MNDQEWLTERFEGRRTHLRAVAYRMLGSVTEADDAVQEAWLRLQRADADAVQDLTAWLTTVVGRVALNMLRSRRNRREDTFDVHIPEPIVSPDSGVDPEHEALLADSVGLALLVVLDVLTPAERLAFVLHDMFAVPFDEIGPMLDRSATAARQLASRARRRVQGQATAPDPDVAKQREVVTAFFEASKNGDFDGLVAVLHPDVILRSDGGAARPKMTFTLRGAQQVANQAFTSSKLSPFVHPALINGAAGVVVAANGKALFVMAFTVTDSQIVAIDVLADPGRLGELELSGIVS